MSAIAVKVAPATTEGRLYARYVSSAGILAVESRVPQPWPIGVDIDGRIVFDLNSDRKLMNFDLHIPKSRWRIASLPSTTLIARPGDIVFSEESVRVKSFSLVIDAQWSPDTRNLRIALGDRTADRAVSLSEKCAALLGGALLVGFWIRDLDA